MRPQSAFALWSQGVSWHFRARGMFTTLSLRTCCGPSSGIVDEALTLLGMVNVVVYVATLGEGRVV